MFLLGLEITSKMNYLEPFVFLIGPKAFSLLDWDMARVITEI
jgi:hypothetical protein